jgi:hypothetical protein
MFDSVGDTKDGFDVVDEEGDVADSRSSFLLTLDDFNETDDNFDTNDVDGDDVEIKSVDKREDIFEGVEQNGREDSTTDELLHGDTLFFFDIFEDNLPTTDFLRGVVFTFDMLG